MHPCPVSPHVLSQTFVRAPRVGMVKPEWVKKGAVVMNVGTTFLPEKKELQPDVDRRVQQVRKQ